MEVCWHLNSIAAKVNSQYEASASAEKEEEVGLQFDLSLMFETALRLVADFP